MAIIEVNHVTKEFRLGTLRSIKQTLLDTTARLRGQPIPERPLFKALDDVDFKVEQGEVLGIIGHNGAGKSTLLKMLANISTPTRGSVKVKGKVAPLIEVGAGLVQDLTGRENIYLNGAILGISKAEIRKKFDGIVEFAELGEFIDTPIKRYSSGMSVRLGFAIATSIDADILIVDEVLAVGDLAFQRKCFDRMEDMIKRQGKTVLLVSHNIRQVERICSRVLLLNQGRIMSDGNPTSVCNRFFEESDKKIQDQIKRERHKGIGKSQASSDIELLEVQLLDPNDQHAIEFVQYGEDVLVNLKFRASKPIERLTFGLGIHTPDLLYLASKDTGSEFKHFGIQENEFVVQCLIRRFPFLPGNYDIRVGIAQGEAFIFYAENLHPFVVTTAVGSRSDLSEEGFVPLQLDWTIKDTAVHAVSSDHALTNR